MYLQKFSIGGSFDEPEEFLGDPAVEHFLGGEQGKNSVPERESHLCPEEGEDPGAGPVTLVIASVQDLLDQVQVLVLVMGSLGIAVALRHLGYFRNVLHRLELETCCASSLTGI